jgi:tetratricopeptide (TPR) repeat protein
MAVLRIVTRTQASVASLRYEAPADPPLSADVPFSFQISVHDEEELRWYLEDYLQYPHSPAPAIAARVERRMAEIGHGLFHGLFGATEEALSLWAGLKPHVGETSVEVISDQPECPWELLQEPDDALPLCLRAQSFVRTTPGAAGRPPAETEPVLGRLRILLVICRPGRGADVPFRSVAARLLQGLRGANVPYELDVVRPPTFERMYEVLREARAANCPYHIVHFDGHGIYADQEAEVLNRPPDPRKMRGYLVFEAEDGSAQYVDGALCGATLAEAKTPLLLLNACRSAHAEPAGQPGDGPAADRLRPLGSFAQEVMDHGTAAVVAMRYNIYVETAARFVGELYAALARGAPVAEAVTEARRQLAQDPVRSAGYEPRPLQDWCVPVVYEAGPPAVLPGECPPESPAAEQQGGHAEAPALRELHLPPPPDVGIFGRDTLIQEVDRAFNTHGVVLLHGYIGSGKTALASEFARWYAATGGVRGPVLFMSFERPMPLGQILDQAGDALRPFLEGAGVTWPTSGDPRRGEAALAALDRLSVFWIWDGLDGTRPGLGPHEQHELADFLRAVRRGRAKFLLTSRGKEDGWLGKGWPHRVLVGPVEGPDCLRLARALVESHGVVAEAGALPPLVGFSFGNPLTLIELIDHAVRGRMTTREEVDALLTRLRSGDTGREMGLAPVAGEGVAALLAAALARGFTEPERVQLSLLCLFQEFVNYEVVLLMGGGLLPGGGPRPDWALPALQGLDRRSMVELLDRAAASGVLATLFEPYYAPHPALRWGLRPLFDRFFPAEGEPSPQRAALRAFVQGFRLLSDNFVGQLGAGNFDVLQKLFLEEVNLRHACRLARANGWWEEEIRTAEALLTAYRLKQRMAEFTLLCAELMPLVADPATKCPLAGREEYWNNLVEKQAQVAEACHDFAEAERLLGLCLEYDRPRVLAVPRGQMDAEQRKRAEQLALTLYRLGQVRLNRRDRRCVEHFQEALTFFEQLGHGNQAANCAMDLGTAYLRVEGVRDLDEAAKSYHRALELFDERDNLGRGKAYGQLGAVALDWFEAARRAGAPSDKVLAALNHALRYHLHALEQVPPSAVYERAVFHTRVSSIYREGQEWAMAFQHGQEAVGLFEAASAPLDAANARVNIANLLADQGRHDAAVEYVRAAVEAFERLGDVTALSEARHQLAEFERLRSR